MKKMETALHLCYASMVDSMQFLKNQGSCEGGLPSVEIIFAQSTLVLVVILDICEYAHT